jgi:hypothetical protein
MVLAAAKEALKNLEAHPVIVDGEDPHADGELIPLPLPPHQSLPRLHHHGVQKHPN